MAQVTFSGAGPGDPADLDANFTELYALRNLATISGSNVGLGGTPSAKLHIKGGNLNTLKLDNDGSTYTEQLFLNNGDSKAQVVWNNGSDTFGIYNLTATGSLSLGTNSAERVSISSSGHVASGTDNTQTMGTASKRWSTVYAGTGTINTSDAREKTAVAPMTASEIAAAKQLASEIGTYRFLDAIEAKGDDARTHVGMTVQRAIEVMESHGLDPMRYGFICHDKWPAKTVPHPAVMGPHPTLLDGQGAPLQVEIAPAWVETIPAGDRYAFRPDELMFFVARGFDARLAALEAA